MNVPVRHPTQWKEDGGFDASRRATQPARH